MNALGSLGSYISKGVCSVSGQFQPFGGAVDIIVVEHSDGSFRSSPWYVRFGKFQGVLKAKEKTVKISVNGAEANFYMHLNNKGQAFFLKEVLPEGEEADKGDQSADDCAFFDGRRPVKSSSYTSPSPDVTNVPRSNSDQTQMIGLQRLNSLEFAEIAAQLLEVNWATALPTGSPKRDVTTFCNGKRGSRVDNLEDDVLRCRIRDSALEEKCEVIAKMGEDTFKEEMNSKAKDHETGHYNRSGTGERDRPGLISESFDESILRPINGEMNQNGDVGNPNHRLCQSLDMKSRPSKPPSVFARSLGGRERQLMGRQNFREGFESSKIFPADTDGKVAAKVNGTRTESDSELKRTVTDNSMKIFSPTSEQLASLKLNEGGNVVTFIFCTKMLGKQQVDARIYLWKWNDRIIISDVDGTITKSDVLGQCMPLVGIDWTQEGVARLYSAIKQNGYRVMFLSARSISQAYITRQFLLNLKQDGEALPDGPVVISPDGIFPSLYREVIRRVPHEFKIACLEDIKALFPPDSNPFYAGFGNRDTDEISYLKVGIPRGKIFIINPKGEVVVNRHVQRRSYISIHSLVDGMFPATTSLEQEDFNSWNYWKLPPPAIEF